LPVGKKFPKSFPEFRPRSAGLAGRRYLDPGVTTLLGAGIYPHAAKEMESHPNVLRFPWYKPCCMPPCRELIIRAVIAGGQSPFPSCDTSLQHPVTANLCGLLDLPK
jgi:hypothetical protein